MSEVAKHDKPNGAAPAAGGSSSSPSSAPSGGKRRGRQGRKGGKSDGKQQPTEKSPSPVVADEKKESAAEVTQKKKNGGGRRNKRKNTNRNGKKKEEEEKPNGDIEGNDATNPRSNPTSSHASRGPMRHHLAVVRSQSEEEKNGERSGNGAKNVQIDTQQWKDLLTTVVALQDAVSSITSSLESMNGRLSIVEKGYLRLLAKEKDEKKKKKEEIARSTTTVVEKEEKENREGAEKKENNKRKGKKGNANKAVGTDEVTEKKGEKSEEGEKQGKKKDEEKKGRKKGTQPAKGITAAAVTKQQNHILSLAKKLEARLSKAEKALSTASSEKKRDGRGRGKGNGVEDEKKEGENGGVVTYPWGQTYEQVLNDLLGEDTEVMKRLRGIAESLSLRSSRFRRTPSDYYDWTLEERRDYLGASTTFQLCKTMIMSNSKVDHERIDRTDSKYYAVIVVSWVVMWW